MESIGINKEIRIQVLDKTTVDTLMLCLIKNGYKVSLHQNKKIIVAEVANLYFKEESN